MQSAAMQRSRHGKASARLLPVCANAVLGYWSIENCTHNVLDGSFAEDASGIRCNSGFFARLRSFAVDILRFNNVHNVTDARGIALPSAVSMQSSLCVS
jgi:predicted transposase YbfD/YdcC